MCPVSNYSAIAQARVFSRSYFVSSCYIRFRSVAIVLILHFFLSLLDIESCNLLSLIARIENSYHDLAISISVELLLLVVNCCKSLLVRLLYLFSVIPGSNIFMLLNSLLCCFTYFSIGGKVYTLALNRL